MTSINAPSRAGDSLARRLWTGHRPALASAALAVAMAVTGFSQASLGKARLEVRAAQQRLAQARGDDKASQQRVALAQFAAVFMREARRLQLQPGRWADQAMGVRQARMGRAEAVALLLQAQNHEGHVFGAQEFDISSSSLKSGLFTETAEPREELVLTLRGRTIFRTR